MKLLGITGGVGMGKSTAARLLQEWGIPVVDTDILARQLVEPGQPALQEITDAFGSSVIDADAGGKLRRSVLAELVFRDEARRKELERILHPRIRRAWLAHVSRWRAIGQPLGAVVIPLLYETHAASEFDLILCVACTASSQRRRLQARGWTDGQLENRIASQWPAEKKMDLAHRVIWTEPPLAVHEAQLARAIGR